MDDSALLDAWRGGDNDAGSQLFARNVDVLYRFFHNKVGADAEDLIQQTMMGCVQSRDNFRGDATFRSYLLRIARHKLYDFLRKRTKDRVDPDFGTTSVMDLGSRLSVVAARGEAYAHVVLALRELPVDLQLVLELHYWEDMSAPEIAKVIDAPVGTVKTRIRRARQLLEERLVRDGAAGELDSSLRDARVAFTPVH